MSGIVIPDEAIEAAGDVYGGQIPDWGLRQILESAAPAILAANEADAERRGAVKALRAEAEQTYSELVANALRDRADRVESGEVKI